MITRIAFAIFLGLAILATPESLEGPMFFRISENHAVRLLDFVGIVFLLYGNFLFLKMVKRKDKPKILVLHFGGQCPFNEWEIEEVRKASEVLGCSYSVIDVEEEPELAKEYKMFFPFMMVVGEKILFSPTQAEDIIKIVDKNEN